MEERRHNFPLDTGWAWVVLTGCFFVNFLFVGVLRSFGLFFVKYLEVFGASVSMTSLVSAIQTTTYSLFSWSTLTFGLQIMSVRQSVMIGAFLCSLSYGLNSLATSIEFLVFTQGLLFGAGSAFLYTPILILIGHYFDKRRGLANGIAIAGNSLGGLVFPPIYSYILYYYGLYGGMVVTSGILLHMFIGAALLRPPSFYKTSGRFVLTTTENVNGTVVENSAKSPKLNGNVSLNGSVKKPLLEPIAAEKSSKPLKSSNNLDETESSSLPMLAVKCSDKSDGRQRSVSESLEVRRYKWRHSTSESLIDIISNSSLLKYISMADLSSQSFVNIGRVVDLESESFSQNFAVCISRKNLCQFDTSLLKHVPYILCITGFCFGCIAVGIGYIFIPSFAAEQGIDAQNFPVLLSVFGGADFIGRLLSGFLADRNLIKKHYIVAISQGIVCVTMNLARFCTNMWIFVIFSGMLGLFGGMITSLNPTIIMEITGIKRYASGIAIYALISGISSGTTTPLLGFLRDYTGTYYMTFHYIGIASFIAMLIYIALAFFVKNNVKNHISEDIEV